MGDGDDDDKTTSEGGKKIAENMKKNTARTVSVQESAAHDAFASTRAK